MPKPLIKRPQRRGFATRSLTRLIKPNHSVIRITCTGDAKAATGDHLRQNEISVNPILSNPMLSIAEIDLFLNDVVKVTLDETGKRLVAKRFWLLPATDDSEDRHIIFVCRPPYARYAREVYDRLQSLHAHPLIHWQIWAPSKKDHPALKLARYKERFEDQMVVDKIRLDRLLSGGNPIMAQELQTASANTRRWAGEAQWLKNPKAMAYFENILADEPMLASCYIYDAQNRITAVGARHTFNQLNQKQAADGRPAILGQTTAFFDDQIRPFRERGIAELRDDNLLDIPVVLNRSYDDRTLHAEFGFREQFRLLSTGEVLEICSYVNLKDYEYWERIALMEQRSSSR